MVEKIIDYLIEKLRNKNWKCSCDECLFNEFRNLTDEELQEIIA